MIKEASFINSQNSARLIDQKKAVYESFREIVSKKGQKGAWITLWHFHFQYQFEGVHMLVRICLCFLVGFLKDETWLNVKSIRTLMKAQLCQNVGDIIEMAELNVALSLFKK